MASKDKRRREPKKQKKTVQKGLSPSIVQPLPAAVDVWRKPRKEREEREKDREEE